MTMSAKKKVYIVAVAELNNKRMVDTGKLKGVIIVVLLLAVLAGFDSYNSYSFSKITGASIAADSESGGAATDQTAKEPSYTGANWVCFDLTKGELVPQGQCETHNSLYESAALGCKNKCSTTDSVTNCGVGSFAVWEACSESNTKADRTWGFLGEGQTKTYAVGGKNYEVTLDFVGSTTSSKFTINGEQSRLLRTGDQWLVDGAWFTLASASAENSAGGTRSADFILMRIKATGQTACTDSDGGKDYYVKGTTVGLDPNGVMRTMIDYCVKQGPTINEEVVYEGYCEDNGRSTFIGHYCQNGCKDGACVLTDKAVHSADCSKGEKAVIRYGETKIFSVGDSPSLSKIYTVSAVSIPKTDDISKLRLIIVLEYKPEMADVFDYTQNPGEVSLSDRNVLKTFAPVIVGTQPYGMQFCIQKASAATATVNTVSNVNVEPGWNLIAVPTFFPGLISTTCRRDDGSASTGLYDVVQIWNYSLTTPYYDTFWLPDNLNSLTRITDQGVSGSRPRPTSAGWVYNYGPSCSITAAIAEPAEPETFKNWTQVAVLPSWEGKALSDLIQSNCNFGGGWFYDNQPSGVKWDEINLNTKFEQKHIGKGFWAYSSGLCTIR